MEPKKKFCVTINFEGCIDYDVEAENEAEAREIADSMWLNEDERSIVSCILEANVSKCKEEGEEGDDDDECDEFGEDF